MIVDNGRSRMLGGKYERDPVVHPLRRLPRRLPGLPQDRRPRLRRGLQRADRRRAQPAARRPRVPPRPALRQQPVRRLHRGLLGAHPAGGADPRAARGRRRGRASWRGLGRRPCRLRRADQATAPVGRARGAGPAAAAPARRSVAARLRGRGPLGAWTRGAGTSRGRGRTASGRLGAPGSGQRRPERGRSAGRGRNGESGSVEREAFLAAVAGGARGGRRGPRRRPPRAERVAEGIAAPERAAARAARSSGRVAALWTGDLTALFVERLGELGAEAGVVAREAGRSRGARASRERARLDERRRARPALRGRVPRCAGRATRARRRWVSARPTGRSPRRARSLSAAAPRCGAATRSCLRRPPSSCRLRGSSPVSATCCVRCRRAGDGL